jgi:uncharacterized SAM-binding protein YcdF (DUF218 family)
MFFTKLLGALLSPLPLTLMIVTSGIVLVVLRYRRSGYATVGAGLALLVLFASEPVGRALLSPLESRYPPLADLAAVEDVRWVVVLGASASDMAAHPATTRLSGIASLRLMEGLRLHQALPDTGLILSGGSVFGGSPSATVMSRAAVALGADPERLRIHPDPRNTLEEARLIREFLGDEAFILVTSASHMPRAMALCEGEGLNPIPAPTGLQTATRRRSGDPGRYLPTASGLAMSETAFHEYLGMTWSRMQGNLE